MQKTAHQEVHGVSRDWHTEPEVLQILQVKFLETDVWQTERRIAISVSFVVFQVFHKMNQDKQPFSWKKYNIILFSVVKIIYRRMRGCQLTGKGVEGSGRNLI